MTTARSRRPLQAGNTPGKAWAAGETAGTATNGRQAKVGGRRREARVRVGGHLVCNQGVGISPALGRQVAAQRVDGHQAASAREVSGQIDGVRRGVSRARGACPRADAASWKHSPGACVVACLAPSAADDVPEQQRRHDELLDARKVHAQACGMRRTSGADAGVHLGQETGSKSSKPAGHGQAVEPVVTTLKLCFNIKRRRCASSIATPLACAGLPNVQRRRPEAEGPR